MRKGFFAICSVLLILLVSIAALIPGCAGEQEEEEEEECTINVEATLCGEAWQGPVNYKLIPESGSPVVGTEIPGSFTVDCGDWTGEYVSGGPGDAYLVDITLDQAGNTSTVTLNFELEQDAWIEFDTWTINGVPIEEWKGVWDYVPKLGYYAEVTEWDVIDIHYTQGVDGCEGYQVTLNETDELVIHYVVPEEGDPIGFYLLDDWCAVNKTVEPDGPTAEKLAQVPSFNGEPVNEKDELLLPWCVNTTLDVETSWELEKCLDYTKSVRWFYIAHCGEEPCCVLFNFAVPWPGFAFQLWPSACVELVDDVDVNPDNNCIEGPPLYLQIVGHP
jgi:hypothetical protein